MNASRQCRSLISHMMSASAICFGLSPRISIIVLSFVFRLTFEFDFALDYLLLERRARTEQHDVFSMLFWYFDCDLHYALSLLCFYYSKEQPISQPNDVVKKPHSPGEVPRRCNRWPCGSGLLLQGLVARTVAYLTVRRSPSPLLHRPLRSSL